MSAKTYFISLAILLVSLSWISCQQKKLIFTDGFDKLERGPISSNLGAQTEYHYFSESKPHDDWAVASFRYEGERDNVWSVRDDSVGRYVYQKHLYEPRMHWHPMLVAGNEFWKDYRAELKFSVENTELQSGLVFRYHNSRCYYFWGLINGKAILKLVSHANGFRKPIEKILAEADFQYKNGKIITAWVETKGEQIKAGIDGGPQVEAADSAYLQGKVAILADVPAKFFSVKVFMDASSFQQVNDEIQKKEKAEQLLQSQNPKPVLWKKIKTTGFGSGRSLRFGDLNGDGQTDVLICQVNNHGPKDRNSEVGCLTAITFDGKMLWQTGTPDSWATKLTSDVAFQIHDFNNDGSKEVIYAMDKELHIADGASGKIIRRMPMPVSPDTGEAIWGDCLYFCDLSGKSYDSDLILKDRYNHLWAYSSELKLLWNASCRTGHYPFAKDTDGDGKDELLIGYTLFDDDGKIIWSKDKELEDHADGVAIVPFREGKADEILIAGSDEGMIFADLQGSITKHYYLGHVQNPTVANFRDDLPGLETISINFWGNQGIVNYYDAKHRIYHDMEPNHYGSMCLPVNWTGSSEEFFVHNANVDEGGLFDGWGRKVVIFPDDGHPDMCNAVLDITGDCRDEIVVWNPDEIWVYTQSDSPKQGKLYKPVRNDLYNESNYKASVLLPGWNTE